MPFDLNALLSDPASIMGFNLLANSGPTSMPQSPLASIGNAANQTIKTMQSMQENQIIRSLREAQAEEAKARAEELRQQGGLHETQGQIAKRQLGLQEAMFPHIQSLLDRAMNPSGTTLPVNPSLQQVMPPMPQGMPSAPMRMENGIPSSILDAMQSVESGGNPKAVSPKGAVGPYQIMPDTAKMIAQHIGPFDSTDPQQSRQAAAWYMGYLKDKYGSVDKALAAYNAGEGAVDSGKAFTYSETRAYVPKVLALAHTLASQQSAAAPQGIPPQAMQQGMPPQGGQMPPQAMQQQMPPQVQQMPPQAIQQGMPAIGGQMPPRAQPMPQGAMQAPGNQGVPSDLSVPLAGAGALMEMAGMKGGSGLQALATSLKPGQVSTNSYQRDPLTGKLYYTGDPAQEKQMAFDREKFANTQRQEMIANTDKVQTDYRTDMKAINEVASQVDVLKNLLSRPATAVSDHALQEQIAALFNASRRAESGVKAWENLGPIQSRFAGWITRKAAGKMGDSERREISQLLDNYKSALVDPSIAATQKFYGDIATRRGLNPQDIIGAPMGVRSVPKTIRFEDMK